MMKIAILFGNLSTGTRPLDFWYDNIYDSQRGLTGSDYSTCRLSEELQKLGHSVSIFTNHAQPNHKPEFWNNIKLYNFDERFKIIDNTYDCIISINEPDALRGIISEALTICYFFLNDFSFCQSNFEDFVDLWLGVCPMHTEHLKKQISNSAKWDTLRLGCDPNLYEDQRVYGRVVWTSSADRGLHNLLQCWQEIKQAVPEATLKIFYHFQEGEILKIEPNDTTNHHHVIEMSNRLRYIRESIKRLKNFGVEHVGSVSVNKMIKEMNEASVLGFSCDTVAFTEGFSISALNSLASFTVPVLSDVDCLGSIYNDSGAVMIKSPVREHLKEFTEAVIESLTNKTFANDVISKCRAFSQNYSWIGIAKDMEKIILENNKN